MEALSIQLRRKMAKAGAMVDSFIEWSASEDDEYATDPLYLDYVREKREADELEKKIDREKWAGISAISRRNRGEE